MDKVEGTVDKVRIIAQGVKIRNECLINLTEAREAGDKYLQAVNIACINTNDCFVKILTGVDFQNFERHAQVGVRIDD